MSGYAGLSQLEKRKLEAAGSSGAVQALRMENDAPVVGRDAPTADAKMVQLDIATADWGRRTSDLGVMRSGSRCLPSSLPKYGVSSDSVESPLDAIIEEKDVMPELSIIE